MGQGAKIGIIVVILIIILVALYMYRVKQQEEGRVVQDVVPDTPSKKVRYVLIETPSKMVNNAGTNYLNLMEVYVYDSAGAVISKNKTVTTNADYDNKLYKPSYLVDGDEKTMMHATWRDADKKVYTTQTAQIDLGDEFTVSKVKIVNRPNFNSRFVGSNVKFLNAAKDVLYTYNVAVSQANYDIAPTI
jgi:hypothetical protein